MHCTIQSAALVGVDAVPVEVEVDVSAGLPGYHIVGLPDGAVREGLVRIRAAIEHSEFALGSMRVTVNLAPADLRKDGAAFDLPIALGALCARELVANQRDRLLIAGELALDGQLRPIRGALSLAEAARLTGLRGVMVPLANAAEAAMVDGIDVIGVRSLREAAARLAGADPALDRDAEAAAPRSDVGAGSQRVETQPGAADFCEVVGQPGARRAAEIAAAGGHNLMLVGPPGAGKTMIARRIAGILPPMSRQEAIETTKIHSVVGLLGRAALLDRRPFRAPHHTCSAAGLVGGGSWIRPGEVSVAHNGVLFLDELPEFPRLVLEALRQPLEDGAVRIVRARQALAFPARFMLVAAMNPCPCGFRGSQVRTCTCSDIAARRYSARISGPLLDRFDLFVNVQPIDPARLLDDGNSAEPSSSIAERVGAARDRQLSRFRRARIHSNAQMNGRQIQRHVALSPHARNLLTRFAETKQMSARALHRCCRVARTIADLAQSEAVNDEHVAGALSMQRERWLGQ